MMRSLALFAIAIAMAACSSDPECLASYKDLGGPEAPCVETSSTAASAQCFQKAQLCPDLSPVRFCSRVVGSSSPVSLLLSNRGEPMMSFKSIKVKGDARCAFRGLKVDPTPGSSVRGGDAIALRLAYEPRSAGEDHAVLEIESDAENFPTLRISICGRGVTSAGQAGSANCLACEDRSGADVNPSCAE